MRIIFLTLIWIFSVISYSFCEPGLLADYTMNGTSIGQTKIQGNLKIIMKTKLKRLTGNIFYQEVGNPFPDLDEKDIIVNFKKGKKHIYTSESADWFTTSLADDSALLDERKISISINKKSKEITATIKMNFVPEFGGKQKYIIKFKYSSATPSNEANELKEIGKPTAVGILSIFIDNERLIELLAKKLPLDNFRIPSKFHIIWKQGGSTKLDVKGTLNVKMNIAFDDSDFRP